MKNGATVAEFERELAVYCGARYAIAAANGTVTLQAALVALGVRAGDRVAVPPLTMGATTIAALNVGAVPVFRDVDLRTWLMNVDGHGIDSSVSIPVSLYGLQCPSWLGLAGVTDDAAQTLRKHSGADFTSLSFQASKILPLGEGGALLTNDEALAVRAREYLNLGYRLRADQARIDPRDLKSPTYARHYSIGTNGRMNDLTATLGLRQLNVADALLSDRRVASNFYSLAIRGCDWLTPQYVPDGWTHDYWTFAVATDTPQRLLALLDAVERHGGERPYPAWRLTFTEPAFRHLVNWCVGDCSYTRKTGAPHALAHCPVAESLQPRLAQMQTNNLASAETNARALKKAIEDLS